MTVEHPGWCVRSLCTATRPGGYHRAEHVQIRDNLIAVLRQHPGWPVWIALEFWDDPEADAPAEQVVLDLSDAALLSDTLTRLADLAGGTE